MLKKIGFVLAGGFGKRMGGDLPKPLYPVRGVPMVTRALNAVREAGVDELVAVLCHRADEIAAILDEDVKVVLQKKPRGTGSALVDSEEHIQEDSAIVVGFGDMPWLNPRSISRLLDAIQDGADAAVLTFNFEDPPEFGRIIRDSDGNFVDIVELKDCDEVQKEISELNAGLFAFRSGPLRDGLGKLDDNNAAGELYLTKVPGEIAKAGGKVTCIEAEGSHEALGVNDPTHLEYAERVPVLKKAEKRIERADKLYREVVPREKWPPEHLKASGE